MLRPPNILTIAGSDSGGGAGIQADLKTMTMLGAYGMSVITALTAQNGLGVTGIHAPDPAFAALQLQTVLDGFRVDAAKTGMLFSSGIMEALVPALEKKTFPLVVDPVCVSTSGHRLLEEDAVETLRKRIVPLADLLTPNRPEAELLAGMSIAGEEDMAEAGKRLLINKRVLRRFYFRGVRRSSRNRSTSPPNSVVSVRAIRRARAPRAPHRRRAPRRPHRA